jgi:hypothetical protein
MNIMRRVAQFALDLNKIQAEALVRLYGRLGFLKMLYTRCGLTDEMATRLEEKMIGAMYCGVEEQHVLASRWVMGESDLADFLDRYQDWFREHLDRCSRLTVEELCKAA